MLHPKLYHSLVNSTGDWVISDVNIGKDFGKIIHNLASAVRTKPKI